MHAQKECEKDAVKKVLVAGSTGYLGKFVVRELRRQGYWIRALARDAGRLKPVEGDVDDVFAADATRPETLDGVCDGIDIAFSSLGITRQRDGLTFMDVDYRANANILEQARKNNVGKFIYISVFNSAKLRHLEIVKAKERFVGELKASGLDYLIISPNGPLSFEPLIVGRPSALASAPASSRAAHPAGARLCENR